MSQIFFIKKHSNIVAYIVRASVFLCLLYSPYGYVHSDVDSFSVQTYVDGDSVPPSVPTGVSATPVALSQVDLTWASSTDDSGTVAGYHVWRDDVLVGTTTVLSYSDTGLASSTLYTYYITAFDATLNESASSTSVVATTLSPVIEVDASQYGSKGASFDEILSSLQVLPQKDSVIIRYETERHARAVVKWGTGTSYELGSLVEQSLSTMHEARITGLVPGTQYAFVIEGEDGIGRYGKLYEGVFMTLPPDDTFPPGNVRGLSAEVVGEDILLSWTNPEDPDFSKVRVLRSDLFYPSDIADGWVVYEGDKETIQDRGVVMGRGQFYTVFSYDAVGNISSGAVVSVHLGTTTPEIVDPSLNPISLLFDDVAVLQGGVELPHQNGVVYIDGSRQFTISIPYEKLPEHLKTILVRIGDSRDSKRTFEFLLRVDVGRTMYTGTIAPFGVAGEFPIAISVFDFETTQVGYTWGVLNSHIRPIHTDDGVGDGFLAYLSEFGSSYFMWLLLLLLLLIFMGRRLSRITE